MLKSLIRLFLSINNIIFGRPDFHPQSPIPAYDFFDGNRHGGHPAYDIFINEKDKKIDKNNDGFIDSTNETVKAISVTQSIVISTNRGWHKGSDLRGGNYVWTYNPYLDMFFYYAHLNDIFVQRGQLLEQGQPIGNIGNTGRKAAGTECHIHLMVLRYENNILMPIDYYEDIIVSKKENLKPKLKALYNDLRSRYPVEDGEYVLIALGDYQKLFLISGNSMDIFIRKEYYVSTGKEGFGAERLKGKTPAGIMKIGIKAGNDAAIGSVFQSLRFTGKVVPINYSSNDSSHPFMTTRIMELVGVEDQNRHFNTIKIHGTNKEGLIGLPDSSGCVRMRNNEIIELYDLIPRGTYVYIVPESEDAGKI